MKEFIFLWDINSFSLSWHETGQCITSPSFTARSMQNSVWVLSLYPRGKYDSDYISWKLCREFQHQGPELLKVNVEVSVVTADALKTQTYFIPETFTDFTNDRYSIGYLVPCFMQRSEVFGRRKGLYLPQDVFTLHCRMWTDGEDINNFDQSFGRTELVIERILSSVNIDIENSVEKTIDIRSNSKNTTLMSITITCGDDMIDIGINPAAREKMKFSICKFVLRNRGTDSKICEKRFSFFGTPLRNVWRLPILNETVGSAKRNCTFETELVYSTGKDETTIERNFPPKISTFLQQYVSATCEDLTNRANISKELRHLVSEEDLCDIKLQVGNTVFSIHKIVLCARSPVFMVMLTSDMKEKNCGCIEIVDFSADTVDKFIDFLYTDSINFYSWEEAIEVYCLAHMYDVKLLVLMCCSYLLKNLNIDRILELLMLADNHHDNELKGKVNSIICEHDNIVFRSPVWKKFIEDKKELAFETMNSKYEEKGNEIQNPNHPKLEDDIRSLYESGLSTDIVIKTPYDSYPAYKTILCARSIVLKNKILNDLPCKSTDIIEIDDLEDDIVSGMLFFLHTDSFINIQRDTAMKLYHAACLYRIRRLKFKCVCYLIENLTVSNASKILMLAHNHQDDEFKTVVEDYIFKHDEEVFKSEEWDDFCESNSIIALSTMRAKYKV